MRFPDVPVCGPEKLKKTTVAVFEFALLGEVYIIYRTAIEDKVSDEIS
jgi:hypothetical protein